ncbi:MAG: phosphoribosyltransferase [Cyclobacteriaceae bacterium]|nr:phosphoribosyltransferase [Cyclobacteriaceae bacterium HetDA_MAG_MS6]
MTQSKNLVLDRTRINSIIKRIAIQIYESNVYESALLLVGVKDQGYRMAEEIQQELRGIDQKLKTKLIALAIDKSDPLASDIETSEDLSMYEGQAVVLIDDVLNTGKTTAHCLKYLLSGGPKRIEIAVLVNRSHSLFPIAPTYSGYELSTALDEHIEVSLKEDVGVYLY